MRGDVPDLRRLLDPASGAHPEAVVVRPSLRAAVGDILQVAAGAAWLLVPGLLALHFGAPAPEPVLFAVLLGPFVFLAPLAGFVAQAFKVVFTRYVIDHDGISVRYQLIERRDERLPWEKVTAVLQRRTIFDSLLGIERIEVASYGGRQGPRLRLVGLRHAAPLRDLLAHRMRAAASAGSLLRSD